MGKKMGMTWSRWLVRMAMVILLMPMAAFAGQEATKESLVRLFQVTNEKGLVDQALESMSESFAKEWETETDPEAKVEKKARFEIADQTIRKHLNWPAVEPLAIECFQQQLQEDDVNALIGYFGTPAGQLRVTKATPALIKGLPRIMAYTSKRADEIIERQHGKQPARKTAAWKPPVAGTREAAAFALIQEMPGARQAFEAKLANIEASMQKNAEMFTGGKGGAAVKSQLARAAKAMKKEITFDEIAAQYAKILADSLSDEEIATLVDDSRQPATKALMAKMDGADRFMQMRLNDYLQQKVLPELIKQLIGAKPEDKSES